jgi:hypothetical protein
MKAALRTLAVRAPRGPFALAGALALAAAAGCASMAALDAAASGRLVDLRGQLAVEAGRGRLGGEARAIARALAAGEIARARGAEGLDRLHDLEGCSRPLEDALDRKAEGADEVSAAAAMALLEAKLVEPGDLRAKAGALGERSAGGGAEAAWRAVGARTLTRAADGARRRELIGDGDEGVRVAALRAAADAADAADFDVLLEVARLDPLPRARALAVHALAVIGGDRVVPALKDLWPAADEPLRRAIVDAWGAPRDRDAGGRAELVWAVETQKGAPAIAAATSLAVDPAATPNDRGEAIAALVRAIGSGLARDRIDAIADAPLGLAEGEAIVKSEGDPDDSVALAALARRLEATPEQGGPPKGSPERTTAVTRLLAVASSGTGAQARWAGDALARAGATEVLPLLERGLTSADPVVRAAAGASLARLGKLSRAAFLLADADPHVRTATACAILSAPR